MKKKVLTILIVSIVLLGILLIVYPTIEVKTGNRFFALRYTDDLTEFETQLSLDECYAYYEKQDISWSGFDSYHFLCFHVLCFDYIEGNYCDTEFLLEEQYIFDFLERAEIEYNTADINLAELIEGREAVVGNTRYLGNEYDKEIGYVLDGEYETLYVFYVDDLLVIQKGLPDEGPRYIAYKY